MWPPALKVIRFLNENLDKFHISKKPSGRMNTADASIVFRLQDEYCTPVDMSSWANHVILRVCF